jgi:hypothetical protein
VRTEVEQALHEQRRICRPPKHRIALAQAIRYWPSEGQGRLRMEGNDGVAFAKKENAHGLETHVHAVASLELLQRERHRLAFAFARLCANRENRVVGTGLTQITHHERGPAASLNIRIEPVLCLICIIELRVLVRDADLFVKGLWG